MTKSIKWRLVTIYVILVIIVMIMSGSLIVWLTSDEQYGALRDDVEEMGNQLSELINTEKTSTDIAKQIIVWIEIQAIYNQDKKIYLLDNYGDVIYPVQEEQTAEKFYHPQVMSAIHSANAKDLDKVKLVGDDKTEYRGYAQPVLYNEKVEYVVYILASTVNIKATLQNTIRVIAIAIVLAIIMAGVLGVIFSNFLTKPISILSKKAREMATGHLDDPIEVLSDDEIGELTNDFNTMASSLKDTLDQISGEKNKLEIVFSHMTDGILVFDKAGFLTHYNPASVSMLNITTQKSYKDVFSKYSDITFEHVFKSVMTDTTQHIIGVRARYYNLCIAKFLSQYETQVGLICVIQDITEHKKLELMQKEFVANVSHELRTPLTTIKSYTETLLGGALHETEIAERFLNVINHESDRMTDLVQDLLDLSKLDNKQTNFKMLAINLNQLLEESIAKYKIHADKKQQQLTFHNSDIAYVIVGDPNRIEQVIKNIVSNAVKYSPEDTAIDVSIYEHDNHVVLEVADAGLGIPEDEISRIFERFYRVDKARSREMGGTGLGLSIAKEIMEYHNGTISVVSQLGHGTTFYLKFPYGSVRK